HVGLARHAVNAIQLAKQEALRIVGVGESIIRPRQLLLRYRAHDIWSDQDHQFGLVVDVIAAPEESAQDRKMNEARKAIYLLLRLLLDHACERQRTARRYFNGGLGTTSLDRRHGQRRR